MKFNYAVYATKQAKANARQAESIKLDAAGNAVNTGHNGRTFTISEVITAQESQSYQVYSKLMKVLDAVIGNDNDTATRNAYTQTRGKFQSVAHAEEMKSKLMIAALNGSNAALIAYASACTFINPYQSVDFSWFFNGSDELTRVYDEQGYEAAQVSVSSDAVIIADESDYEGYAVDYGFSADNAVTPKALISDKPVEIAPMTVSLMNEHGQMLVKVANGWQAQSKTSKGVVHTTSEDGHACNCKGFTYRAKCWHTALVRSQLA